MRIPQWVCEAYPARRRSIEVVISIAKERKVKTQKDIWTFEREMGVNDPNWILVATGE